MGGKLHTGRSRNDQIALDERLYLRDIIGHVDAGIRDVQAALVARAEEHGEHADARLHAPAARAAGRCSPTTCSPTCSCSSATASGSATRRARVDVMPLGAAALAGTAFPIDREALARDLGFAAPSPNSLDAVSDRDFVLEFLAAAAILGMHLSRLAADLTLWATAEFGFVEFSDAFATGSSIMPQKKNPDVAELIRGKTGRLYGNLIAVLAVMKGLPLTYNSDMQEDKEPLFDSVDTLEAILARAAADARPASPSASSACATPPGEHFSTATDLADYLVRKGLPFREAHEVVGGRCATRWRTARSSATLPLDELQPFSPADRRDVHGALTLEASLARARVIGGTAPDAVAPASSRWPGSCIGATAPRDVRRRPRGSPRWLLGRDAAASRCGKKGPAGARPSCRLARGPPAALHAARATRRAVVVGWTIPRTRVDGSRAA